MSAITCSRKPKKIGIVGYYGGNNLGDETVVAILIKTIKKYYPNAELFGFSLNPALTERRHGIKAFPIRKKSEGPFAGKRRRLSEEAMKPLFLGKFKQVLKKWPILFRLLRSLKNSLFELPWAVLGELSFLRRSLHRLKGIDLLVVPGSGPLTDWWDDGPWEHPYSLLSWSILARMAGTEFIALSVGSERLNTRLGKTFCKWALSMAKYRSFRDRYSRDTMASVGLKGDNPVFPDQGFGLLDLIGIDPGSSAMTGSDEGNAGLIVGVCPVGKRCCVQPGFDQPSYERYRENLAAFLLWLIRSGYRIALCPTDIHWDRELVEQIIDTIKSGCPGEDVTKQIIQDPIVTTEDLIARILRCNIMIASRYHGVVLPFVLQKPVLGISYERKIGDVMSELGQADYHLPMEKADVGEMIRLFRALEQHRHSIAQHLIADVANYRSRLARQYEDVLGRFK